MKTIYLIGIDSYIEDCQECGGEYTFIYGDVYVSKEQAELKIEELKKDKEFLKKEYCEHCRVEDLDFDILERDLIE